MEKLARTVWLLGFFIVLTFPLPPPAYGTDPPDLYLDPLIIVPQPINMNPSANQRTITFTTTIFNLSQHTAAMGFYVDFVLDPTGLTNTYAPFKNPYDPFNPNWSITVDDRRAVLIGRYFINALYGLGDCGHKTPDGNLLFCIQSIFGSFWFPSTWANFTSITAGTYVIYAIVQPTGGETNTNYNQRSVLFDVINQPVGPSGGTCPLSGCAGTSSGSFYAQARSDSSIYVKGVGGFYEPPVGSGYLSGYRLWVSTSPDFNDFSHWPFSRDGSTNDLTATVTGLKPNQTYYFDYEVIVSSCATGSFSCRTGPQGRFGYNTWATTATRLNNLLPSNGIRSLLTDNVTLTWQGGNVPGKNVSYDLFWGPGSPTNRVSVGSATSYTLSGLNPATTYNWRVEAHSGAATVIGPTWSFTTVYPPNAAIRGDETFGRYPLTVNFTAQAAGDGRSIVSYTWDFGDDGSSPCPGRTSTSPTPCHTYSNRGTYTARLTVTDDLGQSGSATLQIRVTVNVGSEFEVRANVSSLPAVGFNNVESEYLVTWGENDDIYGKILRASTDVNGATTGLTVVRDTFPITQAGGVQLNPAVAFDGERYLVVWTDSQGPMTCGTTNTYNYNIRGRFFDRFGIPYSQEFDIAAAGCNGTSMIQESNPRMTYAAGKYFLVYKKGSETGSFESKSSGLNPGGTFITPPASPSDSPAIGPGVSLNFPIQLNTTTGAYIRIGPPGLASDGSFFLVVANADCGPYISVNCKLYGIRVDSNGNQEPPFLISNPGGGSNEQPSLAYDPNPGHGYYLVSWASSGVRLAVVNPSNPTTKVLQGPLLLVNRPEGEEACPTGQVCTTVYNHVEQGPVVAFDTLHFFIGWLDGCRTQSGSYATCVNTPEELRGIRVRALDGSGGNYIQFLDDPAQYGIPVTSITARPYKPEIVAAPGPTFVPASITPHTFNMLVVWPDIRDAINTGSGYTGVDIWAVMTHAATPVVQPLNSPTPPPLKAPNVDLLPIAFTAPSSSKSGAAIAITNSVQNQGSGSAGSFIVKYYLSSNGPVSSGLLLGTQSFSGGLAAGSALTQTFSLTIPSGTAPGLYVLGMSVDADDQVTEFDEQNNLMVLLITVDDTPPRVNLTAPTDGSQVCCAVTVTASIDDNVAVRRAIFLLDGVVAFDDTSGADGWGWGWNSTTVTDGSHTLMVKAYDAAGNEGVSANVTVQVDNTPPTAPLSLTATATSSSQINLSWTASSDNVGVTGYQVERCQGTGCTSFVQIASSTTTSYRDTGLLEATSYSYRVRAVDAEDNQSTYSNTATATTLDATPPTAPSSLTATTVSSSQINLAWTASTDNVGVVGYRLERCQGVSCTNFTVIATPTGTSYNDTGLLEATGYTYRVQAVDAAGNLSTYSNTSSATTPDVTRPTAPSNLTATVANSSQINLSWIASSDNVGVTGYQVERCQGSGCTSFIQIAIITGTSYNDTGLLEATSYTYRVRAIDAAGNLSTYSNTASATTLDATPPTAPRGLTATATSSSQINLSWTPSTDNVGVTGYQMERCQGIGCTSFTRIVITTETSYGDTGLLEANSYNYRVRATDAAGNLSTYSNPASATTLDVTAPTSASNLVATSASSSQINLSWTASTDNVGVTGYQVERCQGAGCTTFAQIATATGTNYSGTGLLEATSYSYRVWATDAAGNLSTYSNAASATTLDVTAPTAPSNLVATSASSSQINLFWTASTDNVGVTGYQVERCQGAGCTSFIQIAIITGTSYNDTGLLEATSYTYRVRATDAAGNLSTYSNTASATTLDATPPTAPRGLTATATSSSQINLSWTASTDNVGVTGYQMERCQGIGCTSFTRIAITTETSYGDTGLLEANSYNYRVRATDAAGNLSTYSNAASATTLDATPPTAPSSLMAIAINSGQINLSWTASTDNVGITSYLIERCQGIGCTTFVQITPMTATSYSDMALLEVTSYSYRVRAIDGAGNQSTYSNTGSATTLDTTPPTAPSGLTATAVSSSQINLTWTGSTDNVGVAGYQVERCQGTGCTSLTQIATPTTTSYSDTGLTASTSYSYRVRAADAAGNLSAYSNAATQATAPPLTLTTASLFNGIVGFDYSVSLNATGGISPYSWSIIEGSGSLPPGLGIDNDQQKIVGTPSQAGTFTFSLRVRDGSHPPLTDEKNYFITTASATELAILTVELPVGYRLEDSSKKLIPGPAGSTEYFALLETNSQGIKPYTWSIVSGSGILPPGLSVFTDPATNRGIIKGQTQEVGVYIFKVLVSDGQGKTATQTLTLTIGRLKAGTGITIKPVPVELLKATLGTNYSITLEAVLDNPALQLQNGPLKWSIGSGQPPADLKIEVDNVDSTKAYIKGIPLGQAGSYTFTVVATESHHGGVAKLDLILTVKSACEDGTILVITTQLNAMDAVGVSYEASLQVDKPNLPILYWGITQGSLPEGLFMDTSTGKISGPLTKEGIYNFTVKVSDTPFNNSNSAFCGGKSYKLVIIDVPGDPAGNIEIETVASKNRVDGFDLGLLKRAFGSRAGDSRWNIVTDLNKDGTVDGSDLGILGANFGRISPTR